MRVGMPAQYCVTRPDITRQDLTAGRKSLRRKAGFAVSSQILSFLDRSDRGEFLHVSTLSQCPVVLQSNGSQSCYICGCCFAARFHEDASITIQSHGVKYIVRQR